MSRAAQIAEKCEQAGCNTKIAKVHWTQYVKHNWDPHPPQAFVDWWVTVDEDAASRAHIGGHPDARRRWARRVTGGWTFAWFGITSLDAWNVAQYRKEFEAWVAAGSPERPEPFVSIGLPLPEQLKRWSAMKGIIAQIGKPMPKTKPTDLGALSKPQYAARDEEPIDFQNHDA
jgi:hypothetical protein